MKKVLSLIMAAAMLIGCFAVTTGVTAETYPQLKIGSSATITIPKNGESGKEVTIATFSPAKSGSYVFECKTPYANKQSGEEIPGGSMGVDLIEDGVQSTQGFCFFMDCSYLSESEIKSFKDLGMDMEHINTLKFTATLEANKKYIITAYQDGTEDYSTEITVSEHTHTLKKGEDKVSVDKDGKSEDVGGIYDDCTDWFCSYMDYTTNYYQIVSTTVNDAVYTGKALKPAVIIKTANDKNLNKKYYSVKYKKNKKIGTGKAVITFKNGYTGTVTKTFKINPKASALKKAEAGKRSVKATFKTVKGVTGYQVQTATDKKFKKNAKTVNVKGAKKTAATVKKLKSGKKYFIRVRSYKKVGKEKYYSKWSKVKKVTVK